MDPAGPKRKTSALSACFPFGGGHLRSFHSLRYPDLHCSRSRVNQEWDVLTHFVGSFNHMFSQIKNQPFGWLFIWWRTWDLCRSQAICRSAPPLSVGLSRALLEAPLEPSSFRARPFGFESPQYPHKRKTSALSARFSYGGGHGTRTPKAVGITASPRALGLLTHYRLLIFKIESGGFWLYIMIRQRFLHR